LQYSKSQDLKPSRPRLAKMGLETCLETRDDHGAGVSEWTPAGVCILGWSRSRSQYFRFEPVSSEISDLRNFWLHTTCSCTE